MTKRDQPSCHPSLPPADSAEPVDDQNGYAAPVGSPVLQRALSMTASFARFGLAIVPVSPSEEACLAGAQAANVSIETARRVYAAMVEID